MIESLPRRIHCVGANGAGMLPLTLYLAEAGHNVTAEDNAFSDQSRALLEEHGVVIRPFSEEEESVAVVYSSAIGAEHSARVFAQKAGLITMRRGECLATIAKEKKLIAIAGSHGKTTTCGMLIDLFKLAGVDVDFVLGAQFVNGLPFAYTGSAWLVAEIDESDGTIELFDPEITVVLNADHDHHVLYETAADYYSVFKRLIQRTKEVALVNVELRDQFKDGSANIEWIGEVYTVEPVEAGWSKLSVGSSVVLINRIGAANCMNAFFAFRAAAGARVTAENNFRVAFRAIRRRQSCLYVSPEVCVFEDYAHHPVEIEAVLEQMSSVRSERIVVVFQPHRYSRTAILKSELALSLADVDSLLLLDVYAASEKEIEGGRGVDLFDECKKLKSSCVYCSSEEELYRQLDEVVAGERACVLFIGAGVGDRLASHYVSRLVDTEPKWGEVYRSIGKAGGVSTRLVASEPLANKTTMRVGGSAERYFEPGSLEELQAALKSCFSGGIAVLPIGRGSNLIVPDAGVSGLVIRLSHPIWSRFEKWDDESISVGAGLRIKVLCSQACKEGLVGYEFLEGIPGNVGGVLRMNAGAMGGWIFDVVESVLFVTMEGELVTAKKGDMEFGYRYCRELKSAIAIETTLLAKKGANSQAAIRKTIDTYQEKRRESQPREPSAGCIFKNPEGYSAGRLIDELGLKGAMVGGAEISNAHGNFIVNRGGATSDDVIALVKFARKVAAEKKGVELEPEALLFGSNWEDVIG